MPIMGDTLYLNTTALAGRTVLLTGASGGIGAATATTLGAAGCHLIAHYRSDRAAAAAAVQDCPPDRIHLLQADLSTAAGARELWRAGLQWQDIDVLVVNAAVLPDTPIDGPDEVWDEGWTNALQTNVIGAGALMREAVRHFAARGSGIVIVLSSWAGQQGSRIPDLTAYAASKAAIRNLAQTFARHYAAAGVRFHVLAPGVVNAGMSTVGQSDSQRAAVAAGLAMGQATQAQEIADLVAFLATDACPSLTGATLDMNGASYIR